MSKLYSTWLVILGLFFSFSAFAEQLAKKTAPVIDLPSFLVSPVEISHLSENAVFYNHLMEKRTWDDFDNRITIVHFWASWCITCKNELIALNNLQKEFRKKALLVIAISEDFKAISAIDEFYTKNKINYLDLYVDKRNKLQQILNIRTLPASYILDFNGNIIAQSIPGIAVDWNNEGLKKFLEAKVSKHQLLPPEFKKMRDKYEAPKQNDKDIKAKTIPKNKKSGILINRGSK